MSQTFTLQGNDCILSANYYPPIELDPDSQYCLGLIGFYTCNSIPNIEEGVNNKFIYDNGKVIAIPTGSYEITDIESYLQQHLLINGAPETAGDKVISLKPNNNTLKVEIKSQFDIDFSPGTIGGLLGFSENSILRAGELHTSDLPVRIIKVQSIRIECNLVTGAYYDEQLSHTLFEFSPAVDPGFAISIEPRNITYLPLVNTNVINHILLRIIDQSGEPINFRGENIVVRLELKKLNGA